MIQEQVLNKILSTKDSSIITMNNLDDSFFSDHKDEFNFIVNHFKTYGNIPDTATFLTRFPNFELIEVKEADSYLLEALVKDKQTVELANAFKQVRSLLLQDKIDEAMAVFKKANDKMVSSISLKSTNILTDLSRYDAYLERTQDFNKYYITTGFKELDQIIGGWDREEELATIVARTNVGKSFVLLKCAAAAAKQGLRVGIYSGEMSERKVGYRIDTLLGHISNGAIIHGNIEVNNDYKKFLDTLKDIKGSIKVITPQSVNGSVGVTALRAFIEKENLDILFIDQHSLLEDDRHGKTPVEKASNISKDLKLLQVMMRKPIITVSQQNRTKNEDNKVDTTQVAQSDRIAQDSTVIIFLEKKEDIMKMTLVKSRDSANGIELNYLINLNLGAFTFIPNEKSGTQNNNAVVELEKKFEGEPVKGENVF